MTSTVEKLIFAMLTNEDQSVIDQLTWNARKSIIRHALFEIEMFKEDEKKGWW